MYTAEVHLPSSNSRFKNVNITESVKYKMLWHVWKYFLVRVADLYLLMRTDWTYWLKKSISCRIKTIKINPLQTLLLSDLVYISATNKQNIKAMRYTEEWYEDSLKAYRDMRNTLDNAK